MCISNELNREKPYSWDFDPLWNFMRCQNFHDLLNDAIIWKTRKVEAWSQVIKSSGSIVDFFVTKKLPIEESWDDSLNDINDILLKCLITFIELLLDIKNH
jgi:hypothetical protein